MPGQSAASLQYLRCHVSAAVNGNIAYNPTVDPVYFGFVATSAGTTATVPASWTLGSWETDTIAGQTAYVAKILVGPGGAFVPAAGTSWYVWVKVTDSPEVPILMVGTLVVN